MRVAFSCFLVALAALETQSFSSSSRPSTRVFTPTRITRPLYTSIEPTVENKSSDTESIQNVTLSVEPEDVSVAQDSVATIEAMDESLTSLEATTKPRSKRQRFLRALPGRWGRSSQEKKNRLALCSTDKKILGTAIPSMVNLAVVPLVNAVDTFWVGRMGVALALAGQAAANQAFFTLYFLINYIPTMTAPLVASAVGSGQQDQAQARVCESLFLSNFLGLLGTVALVAFPQAVLSLVLPVGAPALDFAKPYLQVRALSMIPVLVSATGFAAYRGMLDTVTPLKVSLGANLLNLVMDPLLIFFTPLGVVGAAFATALSEIASGAVYLKLLVKRKLASLKLLVKPPSFKSLVPLLQGGTSLLGRQMAINVGLLAAARRAQALDPSGVSAAAYGIVMQLYSVGIVVHIAMQGTAAALVPATLAESGEEKARGVADRIFVWNSIIGVLLGLGQWAAAIWLVPLLGTLPAVQEAVKAPAIMASFLHVLNGFVFAGEGVMLGLSSFRDLMLITASGCGIMLATLASPLGKGRLEGVFFSLMAFSAAQAALVTAHYLKVGPLAVRRKKKDESVVL